MSDEETGATAVADELVPAELQETHAIVVASEDFRQFANGMLEMYREAHGVVFDLTRTRDNDAARALRKRLVSTRTAVEKRRTEGNRADRESVADRIARRDQLAATLTDIVRGLEEPIDAAIRADEARREREAEERRLAEEKRITELRQRVDDITGVAVRAVGMASAEIEAKLSLVGRIEIDDSYQEMQEAAHHAKANTILRLNELLTTARQQEAERAEAERQRLEALAGRHEIAIVAQSTRARSLVPPTFDDVTRKLPVPCPVETRPPDTFARLAMRSRVSLWKPCTRAISTALSRICPDRTSGTRRFFVVMLESGRRGY